MKSQLCSRVLLSLLAFLFAVPAQSQTAPARMITKAIDPTKMVSLPGTVHPLARAQYDLGTVRTSVSTGRLLLLLNRPPQQEAALDHFMHDVHRRNSTIYHRWMTPEQFGANFGPADVDVQTVSAWLRSEGFDVTHVSKSRQVIEFSGTVGQVNTAFATQIHRYDVGGELHYANATDLQIPEALSGIVRAVSPLHDFRERPAVRIAGPAQLDPASGRVTPQFNLVGPGGVFYGLAPEDFATQYDLAPVYGAGINGKGETIGIINDSNIDVSLNNSYRALFGLTNNPTQVVIDGGDPGVNSDATEAYLDVELAGAVAPEATVNLYVAEFDTINDPLIVAAQRAIEDNQADVISVSFGNCEANLGAYNQIISALWQQAAAQGQTVFVSTGDGGSDGCDNPAPPTYEGVSGFGVNGLSSTLWNVAVGGTDFYYSDYASGASSASDLWNSSNDINYGSLKAPLSEQVWNEWFGFNATRSLQSIYAGSGGSSTLYSKPSWQTGDGVPNDGHRDLPDVSLFAGAGANLSGYVICANPGECTSSNGIIPVTVVGGTSASSPALAAIMALIDQKYGRQGQADFVLYPLAHQQPSAFRDIGLGGNNVPCQQGSPDCVLGGGITDNGQYTLAGYPAGAGYDLASGLGTIDANTLINNWNKITFIPTITSLQISSTTFPHGTPVNLTANVTHSSGGANPTGSVSILTNAPDPFNETQGVLPIGTNGTATGGINYFPGGTYEIWASYAGDATYSGGTSSPISLSVTPEASSLSVSARTMQFSGIFDRANECAPVVGQSETTVPNGSTVSPGEVIWFSAQPKGISGLSNATGSVAFSFDNQPAVSVPLNVKGNAPWASSATAAAGTHTVTANYSGDASYRSSQASPFTYTVKQGNVNLFLGPGGICGTGTTCTAYSGDMVPIEVFVQAIGCVYPTGTVSVTMGGQSQMVTLSQEGSYAEPVLTGLAEFSNLTPGTYSVLATYSGDSNYQSTTNNAFAISVISPSSSRISTTTTIAESTPVILDNGGSTAFAVTVQGGPGSSSAPTGLVEVYADGVGETTISLSPSGATSASGTSGELLSDGFIFGVNQITAVYTGDSTFQESVSAPITLTVGDITANPDFTITPANPQLAVAKSASVTTTLSLASTFGFSGDVSLSCTTSSADIGCSISPSLVTLNSASAATLSISSVGASKRATSSIAKSDQRWRWLGGAGGTLSCFFVLASLSGTRKRRLGALMLCSLLLWTACGAGSHDSGVTQQQPPPIVAQYSVLVTGTSNGTVHNAKILVLVR